MITMVRKKSIAILMGLILMCVAVISLSLIFCNYNSSADVPTAVISDLYVSKYPMGKYEYGAVVSNGGPCAVIGKRILARYGSAVDSLIATMVCEGAACMQNMGPGGGFLLTGYHKESKTVYTLNARETAPAGSFPNMFHGNETTSTLGGLSVGVPGELKGYHELYKRYGGKAPWDVLFEDTIKLCLEGVPINKHLAASLVFYKEQILASPTLKKLLIKEDGTLPVEGDLVKLPKLAETLKLVAEKGPDVLYDGELTANFVRDIQDAGGIITKEDMANYKVRWEEPIVSPLSNGLTLYSVKPPGSGLILSFMLRLLDDHLNTNNILTDVQRITEAFKFGYGRRTELGDSHFEDISKIMRDLTNEHYIDAVREQILDNKTFNSPEHYGAHFYQPDDHGTANVAVLAANGDAVVATSTVNLVFGSMVVSESTGIVLNDQMDDFSAPNITNYFGVPPSPANFIAPGKRPMSSMCPTIILNRDGTVRLAIGAAGGTRITTATALVTIWHLWYNRTIKQAVDEARFHHQLWPMQWSFEFGVKEEIANGMEKIGHQINKLGMKWRSAVTAIAQKGHELTTVCDFRRPGSINGII